jgi:CHAT domain-containing protein
MQSALLLSSDDKNDGRLEVSEIFDLDLQGTNLVVLSACETAAVTIEGGDDLVGLSRGFIYAGTPSLLATLWKVDDKSTEKLMRDFYINWRTKNLSKADALRQAQLSLKTDKRYNHPYYWAPFVIIGDWM